MRTWAMLARVRIVCFAYSSCGFHVTYVGLYQTPRLETGLASTPGMNSWLILYYHYTMVRPHPTSVKNSAWV